jgi:hypothetical protein
MSPLVKINIGVLLRNGSAWFGFTPRNHIPRDIPSDTIPQQITADGQKGVKLYFITLKITIEMIRIFLH